MDNVLVCQSCFDLLYPDGHESITLGFVGSRVCTYCAKPLTPQDSYGWLKRGDWIARVNYFMKRLKSVEDNLHERIEDWDKLDKERLAALEEWTTKKLNPENQEMYNKGYAAAQATIAHYLRDGFPQVKEIDNVKRDANSLRRFTRRSTRRRRK